MCGSAQPTSVAAWLHRSLVRRSLLPPLAGCLAGWLPARPSEGGRKQRTGRPDRAAGACRACVSHGWLGGALLAWLLACLACCLGPPPARLRAAELAILGAGGARLRVAAARCLASYALSESSDCPRAACLAGCACVELCIARVAARVNFTMVEIS